jgi:hypothetical protein
MSKGIDRIVEQLFNFKFEVFRSNLRLHWFSIGLRFRDEAPQHFKPHNLGASKYVWDLNIY